MQRKRNLFIYRKIVSDRWRNRKAIDVSAITKMVFVDRLKSFINDFLLPERKVFVFLIRMNSHAKKKA
jgi:hypothetical protein